MLSAIFYGGLPLLQVRHAESEGNVDNIACEQCWLGRACRDCLHSLQGMASLWLHGAWQCGWLHAGRGPCVKWPGF